MAAGPDGCVEAPEYDASVCGFRDVVGCAPLAGCGEPLSVPFFMIYQLFVPFVFLNLFIGVILEGFYASGDLEAAASIISAADMEARARAPAGGGGDRSGRGGAGGGGGGRVLTWRWRRRRSSHDAVCIWMDVYHPP